MPEPEHRIRAETAFEVISRTGKWVRDHRRRLEESVGITDTEHLLDVTEPFWKTMDPLYDSLVHEEAKCAWCAAGIKISSDGPARIMAPRPRSAFRFYPVARKDVEWETPTVRRPGWKLASLISRLSEDCHTPPYEILLTSDVCINALQDNTPFVISRMEPGARVLGDLQHWELNVSILAEEIWQQRERIEELLFALDAVEPALKSTLAELDSLLCRVLVRGGLSSLEFHGPADAEDDQYFEVRGIVQEAGSRPGLPLAKYLAFMTVIWPNWQRICMLPHIGPYSDYAQPGGIVICEDRTDGSSLDREELEAVSNVSSIAMWPWLVVREREGARRGGLVRTPYEVLEESSNDYAEEAARLEAASAPVIVPTPGELGQMEDKESETWKRQRKQALNSFLGKASTGLSVVIPVRGRKLILLECLEGLRRQTYIQRKPQLVEIIIVQDGDVPERDQNPICDELMAASAAIEQQGVVVKIVRLLQQLGRSSARNVGIWHSTREYILFVDSSMVLQMDFMAEQMMRHRAAKDIALLGFKEKIEPEEYNSSKGEIALGTREPDFTKDWKYARKLTEEEATAMGRETGEEFSYMKSTDYLQGMPATQRIGVRTLPTFFQTNIVSTEASRIKEVGGFEQLFEALWGFEDSFLGALLIALCGVKLVPCPSSVAFKIEHREPHGKPIDTALNRDLMDWLLKRTSTDAYSKTSLEQKYNDVKHLVRGEHGIGDT